VQVIIIKLSNNSCVNIKQEVSEKTFTEFLKSNNLITSFRSGNLQISKNGKLHLSEEKIAFIIHELVFGCNSKLSLAIL